MRCNTATQDCAESSLVLKKTPHIPCSYQPVSLAPHWSLNTAGKARAALESDDRKEPVMKRVSLEMSHTVHKSLQCRPKEC